MRISDWSSDVCSSDLYGLYGLLPPLAAFLLLALVAFTAFALALLHGPFLAVLALLGGFVTPLLVECPAPSVWGLFEFGRASCRARVCQFVLFSFFVFLL